MLVKSKSKSVHFPSLFQKNARYNIYLYLRSQFVASKMKKVQVHQKKSLEIRIIQILMKKKILQHSFQKMHLKFQVFLLNNKNF